MDEARRDPERLLDDAVGWAVRTVGQRLDGPAKVLTRALNRWES